MEFASHGKREKDNLFGGTTFKNDKFNLHKNC